ncbi:unnamed protein product [Ceutorhynchus assimilis]|uniref:Voltage-dependent anion-selective channel n=1 Tax=Ceutorhynchus assimilis TaxID=467358 RepID=A0A9N9N162_9CUCU|nr:unnamed protein product [Ceutorhynchus assimilis]
MDNPCKPKIDEKLYNCPKLTETNIKGDASVFDSNELQKVECGKGNFWGSKTDSEATGKNLNEDGSLQVQKVEVMAPPPYSDLGKQAKDVFGKGYHFGLVKLDVKTKSTSGVEFSTSGSSNQESGKVAGSLETKYKVKDYGLTFTEKWTTDNTLSTELAVQDQVIPGLKLSTALNFAPQTGQKTGNVKAAFVNKQIAVNADSDFTADGGLLPNLTASAVVGYQGWLAGYQAGFDVNNKKLTKSNFALGFTSGDFTLHSNVNCLEEKGVTFGGSIYQQVTPKLEYGIMAQWVNADAEGGEDADSDNVNLSVGLQFQFDKEASIRAMVDKNLQVGLGDDGQEFGGSIYQKINPQLETGVSLNWSAGSSNTKFGIGAKYNLDKDAALRFKVNNQSQIGLGYQQRLRDGVTLTLSSLIDGKNFNQGGHKIGLALELEA